MKSNVLGSRITSLRQSKKLSQLEFSKILNISNTTLSQYESGKRVPSDDIKIQIADYFDVSLDYLFGRTNIKDISNKVLNGMYSTDQLNTASQDNDLPPEAEEEIVKFKAFLRHKYSKV